jgi:hypothetical protein
VTAHVYRLNSNLKVHRIQNMAVLIVRVNEPNARQTYRIAWCTKKLVSSQESHRTVSSRHFWQTNLFSGYQIIVVVRFNFFSFGYSKDAKTLGILTPGNTKGGSITVPFTSCLTGLESAVWQLTIFVFIFKTDESKPVKQEVNSTVILSPLVFPADAQRGRRNRDALYDWISQ